MTVLAELLSAEFVDGEVLQFRGRGDKVYDYIEDETVMDRLDEVLGVGSWNIGVEPISVADGIVLVTLSGETPDGKMFRHQDFGYQSNSGGEGLKEAVSDGIRRCGRYLGIARYLYRKHPSAPASQPPAVLTPIRPTAPANPYSVPEEPPAVAATFQTDRPQGYRDPLVCPVHQKAWKSNSRGQYCSSKLPDGSWCQEKPR